MDRSNAPSDSAKLSRAGEVFKRYVKVSLQPVLHVQGTSTIVCSSAVELLAEIVDCGMSRFGCL